jgi:glycerophosphoryl diester phosphodiesterase
MSLILPSVIGHRGACGYAPENTLASLATAADMGIKWVEFDVMLTKDGVPVLHHDETLERTTSLSGRVCDMPFATLKTADAGSWFGDSFVNEPIPTLEQAMDLCLQRGLGMNVEIKPCEGFEVETAEVALDVLSRTWDDMGSLLISSFQPVCLVVALNMAPDYARGLLLETDIHPNWREMVDHLEPATINFDGNSNKLTREQVEDFMDTGCKLAAYTINDPARARLLYAWGVDSVFSDVPDVILGGVN